ncbi:MAG: ATP synthase subunit I [Deltaproteobacteria bacterium]|nr:ATP synthase subunit I [Deltaproteobacteria bacterium]
MTFLDTAMYLVMALAAGTVLGLLYFWGLRVTVDRLVSTSRPVRLMLSSYALRAGGLLTGFYLIMGGHGERLVALLVGFLLARHTLIRRWGGTATPSR